MPRPNFANAFIYCITHIETGMRYVGCTEQSLSERWAGHRSVRKRNNNGLYRSMNEWGLHMFVMEELEECGRWIKEERELDYMRKWDSWNPQRGYNNPTDEAKYARKVYFLLNPGKEPKYRTLRDNLSSLDLGFREPLPNDQKLREELREFEAMSLQEGRRLMKTITSLVTPVILESPSLARYPVPEQG